MNSAELLPTPPSDMRHDWRKDEILALHQLPLFELLDRARAVHLRWHPAGEVQLCQLLSIKTGGCPEDCAYCPQSAHYETGVDREPLLALDRVINEARDAKERGVTRFCMGAAWRQVSDGPEFDAVLDMVRGVS